MSYTHKSLAEGRWSSLPLVEQMANVGSEVERTIKWKEKGKPDYSQRAFERALELMDLTLACTKGFSRLKELARARELMVDYFVGANEYGSTDALWRKYFAAFTYAARRTR